MPRIVGAITDYWHPVDVEHRCSAKRCARLAVIVGTSRGHRYRTGTTYSFRRFLCREHAAGYSLHEGGSGRWWFAYSEPYPLTEVVDIIHRTRQRAR